MSDQTTSIDRLSEAIAEGMIDLDPDGVPIVLALYRLLSRGDPVSPSLVADESLRNVLVFGGSLDRLLEA
jgi:allophanate hydrolase subunit 2